MNALVRKLVALRPGQVGRRYTIGTVWHGGRVIAYARRELYEQARGAVVFDVIARDVVAARDAAVEARKGMGRYPDPL